METIFSKETVLGVADEIMPLLELHYEEVALNRHVVKLNPDWPLYCAMEERGIVHVFTVRQGGKLVGYAVFFLKPHIHYKDLMVATDDLIFVHRDCRRGTVGARLIKFCEQQMKQLGAHKITWHVKKHLNWSPLLIRDGYEEEETILGKIL